MKFLIILLVAGLGIASAAEPQRNIGVAASGEKRVALVIGNAAYPGVAALKNPANDARDIGAKLKKLGFDVTVRTDLRYREMLRSLTEFGDKVQPGTEALFFYAGHGMQVRGRNYLIPLDAEIRTEASVSSEAVDVDQLLDKLSPARLSMVILDACRNNPFERRFRGGGQGLASINAPTGTLIAYATAPGKVASDGDSRNGLYTQELLAAMDIPGIKVEDVFKRVRSNVVKKSGDAQTPWESSSLTGDFYFLPDVPSIAKSQLQSFQPTPTVPSAPSADEAEVILWSAVEQSNHAGDYEVYLGQYPRGSFAALAIARLDQLKQEASTQEETKVWLAAENGGKLEAMTYLERYPHGRYVGVAKLKLVRLQKEESVNAVKAENAYVGTWAWNGDKSMEIVIFKNSNGVLDVKKGERYGFFATAPQNLSVEGTSLSMDFPSSPRCTFKLVGSNRLEGGCGSGSAFLTRIETTTEN